MSDRTVTVIADGLTKFWLECDNPFVSRRAEAEAILAALKTANIGVVELPEPTSRWAEGPEWRYGNSVVWTAPGGSVMVQNVEPGDLHPEQARTLAAWLLSAADAAEATR